VLRLRFLARATAHEVLPAHVSRYVAVADLVVEVVDPTTRPT
jgi:hypothetical protein